MSVLEFLFGAVYFSIAFALAVGCILAFAILLGAEDRLGGWVLPATIPLIALGICTSSLLSGRDLRLAAFDLTLNTAGVGAGGSWLLRGITIVLLGIWSARIAGQWLRRNKVQPVGGGRLFVGFALLFSANNLLNSAFGTEPAFIHNLLYPIVVFAAAYAARREPLSQIISMAKLALFGMMFLSLAVAVVKPDLALQPNYKGWIPGLSIRLWGVGSNANSIGPLALVALLIEYMQPYRRRWVHGAVVAASVAVLVLAQSKTVWVAGLFVLAVLAWHRFGKVRGGVDMRFALIVVVVASVPLLAMLMVDPTRIWNKLFMSPDVTTISGRAQIWSVALSEWLRNPLFGYGPEIWGPVYRERVGMQFAFHAHNQFLQSLSAAGTLGVVSLVIYLWFLGKGALLQAEQSRGVSVALYVLVLLRCMTETPLTVSTLFNGDILMHLLLFVICLRGVAKQPQPGLYPIKQASAGSPAYLRSTGY